MPTKTTKKRAKRDFKLFRTLSDRNGNCIRSYIEPRTENRKLYILLAGEERERLIGEIDVAARTLNIRRDRAKHYHFKAKGYGFNWSVINESKRFDTVMIKEKNGTEINYYAVPRDVILSQGTVMNFANQGFELQKFVPLAVIQAYKTEETSF